MYAIVQIGGHQYKVKENDVLFVDKQQTNNNDEELTFTDVLLIKDDSGVKIGSPVIEGASVSAKLLENVKSDKVIVFKKKRRKGYRVKNGHRQEMSQIEITGISASGSPKKKSKADSKKSEETAAKKNEENVVTDAALRSTDMSAKEAIDHINNTPLDKLSGFVPGDEERKTVLKAWENKQEN